MSELLKRDVVSSGVIIVKSFKTYKNSNTGRLFTVKLA